RRRRARPRRHARRLGHVAKAAATRNGPRRLPPQHLRPQVGPACRDGPSRVPRSRTHIMLTSLRPIVHAILEDNALLWFGDHGISHWARVLENGLRLSTETGADPNVVSLFAVFHDS